MPHCETIHCVSTLLTKVCEQMYLPIYPKHFPKFSLSVSRTVADDQVICAGEHGCINNFSGLLFLDNVT